ncbi:exodeoxyribonuclease VII small subunit [Gemella sp.]|uniref:exodeoxyribonuclease VII small subunit n=1 Tax=uncultured Gemella sp. TaxID=254352 RepID=UPI0028D3D4F9|nr:exodeoxyribonuclease VII small subunit [uncultured Gemella sp.]
MIKENFETSLMNLEKIVAELESGQLSLEDSLERYKNGIDLIKHCNKLIDKAEKEVVKLTKDFKENE